LASGARGAIPKDLWFGVFRRENRDKFLGNRQLFMNVSGRGVEFGFAASTHPSDFTNPEIKARLRAVAPRIYDLLPAPNTVEAHGMGYSLEGNWSFRTKSRLEPDRSDFPDLNAWLAFFKSPAGAKAGGGCIAKYLDGASLDDADLEVIGPGKKFSRDNGSHVGFANIFG
jgi:hypothetical protein